MYKKIAGIGVCCLFLITGCLSKNSDGIVNELTERSRGMKSYMSSGKMTMYTGASPIEYDVTVWFQEPDRYRVSLNNKSSDITQVLLRNVEGSYILTPQLNKRFQFQSDWYKDPNQIYLYQANISSILADSNRQFQKTDTGYQFDVKSPTEGNPNWSSTRILLDRKLYPKEVAFLNQEQQPVAKVEFSSFKYDTSFDDDAFDVNKSMSIAHMASDVRAVVSNVDLDSKALNVGYVPKGSKLSSVEKLSLKEGSAVVMRYNGKYNFTVVQCKPSAIPTVAGQSRVLNLDSSLGLMTTSEQNNRMSWIYHGVEFTLYSEPSDGLTVQEMSKIANGISEPKN